MTCRETMDGGDTSWARARPRGGQRALSRATAAAAAVSSPLCLSISSKARLRCPSAHPDLLPPAAGSTPGCIDFNARCAPVRARTPTHSLPPHRDFSPCVRHTHADMCVRAMVTPLIITVIMTSSTPLGDAPTSAVTCVCVLPPARTTRSLLLSRLSSVGAALLP